MLKLFECALIIMIGLRTILRVRFENPKQRPDVGGFEKKLMRIDSWLAAPDEWAPVEMEMIVVGGIEIRAERDAKIAAGAAVDRF